MSFYLDDDVLTTAFMQTTELIDRYISVDNVWSVGYNASGQLGLNNIVNRSTFTSVTTISDVKAISVGQYHTIALKNNGTVWTVGRNEAGQLGLSDVTHRSTFTSVPNLVNINSITGNSNATLVSDTTGKLYVFGSDNGKFGFNTSSSAPSFQSIPNINSVKAIMPGNGNATSSGYLTFPSSSDSIFKVWN